MSDYRIKEQGAAAAQPQNVRYTPGPANLLLKGILPLLRGWF